ncbi:MAG: PEP-CTERM sorting domain-containing protein [Phycisphaeraceae bacterium]
MKLDARPTLALLAALSITVPAHADEGDAAPHVLIGVLSGTTQIGVGFEGATTDASGNVLVQVPVFENLIPLTPLSGFRNIPFDPDNDLAFEAPGDEEADELEDFGLIAAPTSALFALEAVDLPADFAIFVVGQTVMETTGDSIQLGSPEFDLHPLYVLETLNPSATGPTTGLFRIIDLNGGLLPSDTFGITLAVPEPASAAILGLAGLTLIRRR